MLMKKMFVAVAAALGAHLARSGLASYGLALALEKDAWGKLPKEQQGLYAEKDGRYNLDVDGIEDTSGLKSALEKERTARKTAEGEIKALAKKWEGLDADELRRLLEQLGGDKEAQLIKAGKLDEVVAIRMEKASKAHEKALKEASDKVAASEARVGKFSQRVLDNEVRAAAGKAGLHVNAVDDALFRARSMFVLNDEGEVVQLGKDGHPVMGKDGKTPFSPGEWLDGMKETAPHWFPSGATGGGSTGGKGGAGGKTMRRADFEKLNPAERAATAKDGTKIVD